VARSLYIFDAGPGVERRMLEAVAKGTKIDTIPAVFITTFTPTTRSVFRRSCTTTVPMRRFVAVAR